MKDFTLNTYKTLLEILKNSNYNFQSFNDYLNKPLEKVIILRHDIDLKKRSSLLFAKIENDYGIKGTYFFRAVKKIFDKKLISEVASLGHEIGYHYEDLSLMKGDYNKAIKSFETNLKAFRDIYPVSTICMHGNSLSKFDNRLLWEKRNYKDYNLIGEPYFDLDFNEILYLTDSAQRWNGDKIAVRDKVKSNLDYNFTSTFDIINSIDNLPNKIMFTIHPDRWTNNILEWHRIDKIVKIKNFIKKNFLIKRSGES